MSGWDGQLWSAIERQRKANFGALPGGRNHIELRPQARRAGLHAGNPLADALRSAVESAAIIGDAQSDHLAALS